MSSKILLSLVQTETSSIRTSLICQPVDASSLFPDICLVLVAFISIGKLGCGLSTEQLSFSGTLESVPKGLVRHGSPTADLPWLHSNRHNLYRSQLTSPHLHLRILTLSQMTWVMLQSNAFKAAIFSIDRLIASASSATSITIYFLFAVMSIP